MSMELTFDSWQAEVNKTVSSLQGMTSEFFAAYKKYILHAGAARFIKGSAHEHHIQQRNIAEADMKRLNPRFNTNRAKRKMNSLYEPWSTKASAATRSRTEKESSKKPFTDMGSKGGTNPIDFEQGGRSFRRSRGRRSED